MLLSNLIEDLQELAEEHGKEIEVAVVIESIWVPGTQKEPPPPNK